MKISLLSYALWVATASALIVQLFVVIQKRIFRLYPVFSFYIAFEVFVRQGILALALATSAKWYYWSFWISKAIAYVLQLSVMVEIFGQVFKRYSDSTTKPRTLALIGVAVSIGCISILVPSFRDRCINHMQLIDRTLAITECGLLLLLGAWTQFLALSWPRQALGIAGGFGIFCGMDLLVTVAHSQFGWVGYGAFKDLRVASYFIAVVFWNYALLSREPAKAALAEEWITRITEAATPISLFLSIKKKENPWL